MASPPTDDHRPARRWLFRAVPWLVTLGALAYIGLTTDLPHVWHALGQAELGMFILASLGVYAVLFPADSYGLMCLFRWFHADVRFREVLTIRGASYLLGIVNYNAAIAGMALYLKRTRGVSVLESVGSFLFINLIDLALLVLVIGIGGEFVVVSTTATRVALAALLVGLALTWAYWRGGINFVVLGFLRRRTVFRTFEQARLFHYLGLALRRLPVMGLYILLHFLTLQAFGIHIPIGPLLVYVPIQLLIAALPISIAGIGTVQVAQRVLYGPYAELSQIDAYGAALVLAFLLPRVLIGLATVRTASRELARGTVDTEEPSGSE